MSDPIKIDDPTELSNLILEIDKSIAGFAARKFKYTSIAGQVYSLQDVKKLTDLRDWAQRRLNTALADGGSRTRVILEG